MSELRKISILFCILLALFAFRCGMEDEPIVEHEEEEEVIEKVECEEEEREYIPLIFQDLLSPRFCKVINIDEEYDYRRQIDVIIDNQEDYEYYIQCNDGLPEIDFDEYFLVAGMYYHFNGYASYEIQKYLCFNHFLIDVKIRHASRTALTRVYYFVIVENKHKDLPIQITASVIFD